MTDKEEAVNEAEEILAQAAFSLKLDGIAGEAHRIVQEKWAGDEKYPVELLTLAINLLDRMGQIYSLDRSGQYTEEIHGLATVTALLLEAYDAGTEGN